MNETTKRSVESPQVEVSPLVHVIAPIVAIGATMLVRKAMNVGYRRATGTDAPGPRDPGVTLGRALIWAVVTAATAAAVEVAVYRITARTPSGG
jgi:hypothetical protein